MKTLLPFTLLAMFFLGVTSCSEDENIIEEEVVELTSLELADLLFLREEEKLARDVYKHMFDLYDFFIFQNIGNSEQKHMDLVKETMDQYQLSDPVIDQIGKFNNEDLQSLYNQLIARGSKSFLDALIVGATIEDIDIYDLTTSLENTDKPDLIKLYTKLRCGSQNHMRGFTGQIKKEGGTYTPQFIDQITYDEILEKSHESCH